MSSTKITYFSVLILYKPLYLQIFLNQLHAVINANACAVYGHIVVNRVGPVVAVSIVFVVVCPELIRVLNGGGCDFLCYAHVLNSALNAEAAGCFNIYADHVGASA